MDMPTNRNPAPDPRLNRIAELHDRSLLFVDDDAALLEGLGRALAQRGFEVMCATTAQRAIDLATMRPPAFALVDLRLKEENGLEIVDRLRMLRGDTRIVIFSGYGSIEAAVSAIKHGAVDYLAKPADADEVAAALLEVERPLPRPPQAPYPPEQARIDHIRWVYEQTGRNKSETARRLRMHRRTLQRILCAAEAEC